MKWLNFVHGDKLVYVKADVIDMLECVGDALTVHVGDKTHVYDDVCGIYWTDLPELHEHMMTQ